MSSSGERDTGSDSDTVRDPTTSFLARAAKDGRERCFAELYERVAPAMYTWAALRIRASARSALEPEDLVQEVWCRALGSFPAAYDPDKAPFRPWIFAIATHVLIDALRRFYHRRSKEQRPDGSRVFQLDAVPADVTTLTRRIAEQEAVRRFLDRVQELPDEERKLLVYRGLEALPHAEVARRLSIDTSAVRKRWERLRARLREMEVPAGVVDDA